MSATSPIAISKDNWRKDRRKTSERGYGWQWQKARALFLQQPDNALCVMCKKDGRVTEATVVDHIVPHRGNETLFWDRRNWQSLCLTHHNSDKQAIEKSGRVKKRIGLDGFPIE